MYAIPPTVLCCVERCVGRLEQRFAFGIALGPLVADGELVQAPGRQSDADRQGLRWQVNASQNRRTSNDCSTEIVSYALGIGTRTRKSDDEFITSIAAGHGIGWNVLSDDATDSSYSLCPRKVAMFVVQ
jgi:hypothetical protein